MSAPRQPSPGSRRRLRQEARGEARRLLSKPGGHRQGWRCTEPAEGRLGRGCEGYGLELGGVLGYASKARDDSPLAYRSLQGRLQPADLPQRPGDVEIHLGLHALLQLPGQLPDRPLRLGGVHVGADAAGLLLDAVQVGTQLREVAQLDVKAGGLIQPFEPSFYLLDGAGGPVAGCYPQLDIFPRHR